MKNKKQIPGPPPANTRTFIILPTLDPPQDDSGVVPAYYEYPKTIQSADEDFLDAEWARSDGTRVKRQEANERLKETLGD